MNIISVLARENIGRIDWEPYIPMLFARILRSLDLPVTYKSLKSARNQQLWSSSIASKRINWYKKKLFSYFCFVS